MKRIFLTGLFASLIAVACFAQKPYKVVFYNFENLFDTIHDPGVLDEEFTPEGPKKWNSAKYTRKIGNLERVLFDIAAEDKDYPVVIGVSEIENRSVMEDVIAQPANGYYVGIKGTQEQWETFFQNPNFQLSISVKHNENPFEQLGSALACRQNQSVVAQVMRLIARVMTN